MLVVSRKANESFVIGDNIVVTVLKIVGGKVSLGIEAPRDVDVRRSELAPRSEGKDVEPKPLQQLQCF